MKRLLITGASGFIGRACLLPAVRSGFEVHALTSRPARPDLTQISKDVRWHQVNLLDQAAADEILEIVRPSHILHLAWVSAHGVYWKSPENMAWLAMGAGLLKKITEIDARRIVSAGTCAEYQWGSTAAFREDDAVSPPHSFYGKIKLAAHQISMTAAAEYGFSAATGRVFFVYGPYDNPARLIPYTCLQLLKKRPADFGGGTQIRDFLHVSDVAEGLVALLHSNENGAFNICSGQGVAIKQIVEKLGRISHNEELLRIGHRPDRPDDVPTLIGNNDKLRSLGWKPSISLETGLNDVYGWWRENLQTAT